MPETKIRKQCVLYGHAAYLACLVSFKFARFSLSDRRYRYRYFLFANIVIISFYTMKKYTCTIKKPTLLSHNKVKRIDTNKGGTFQYLFG